MIRRILKLLVLLLLLILGLLAWILATEQGNRLLLNQLPVENLSVEGFSGRLLDSARLTGVRYSDGQQEIKISQITLEWEPSALWERKLHIRKLIIGRVAVERLESSPPPADEPAPEPFEVPQLPVDILLEQLAVESIEYRSGDASHRVERLSFSAESTAQAVEIDHLSLNYDAFSLNTGGTVNASQSLPFDIQLTWQGMTPELGEIRGQGRIHGDLERLRLEHRLTHPARLTTSGEVKLANGIEIDLKGDWEALQWPLNQAAEYFSPAGDYRIRGPVERLETTLNTRIEAADPRIPPATVALETLITPDRLQQLRSEIGMLDGKVELDGEITWSSGITWNLELNTTDINPGTLMSDWPARLNLRSTSQGSYRDERLVMQSWIKALEGELRGYPLKGSGGLRLNDKRLTLEKIRLSSGENRLRADGTANQEQSDLRIQLNAPDLETLYPGLSGKIDAEATLKGNSENPRINLSARGEALQLNELQLQSIDAEIDWRSENAAVSINILQPEHPAWKGNAISLQVDGTPEAHTIALSLDEPSAEITARLSGGWREQLWQGGIEQIGATHLSLGQWENQAPAEITLGRERIELAPLCLQQAEAKICTELTHTGSATRARASLSSLPLNLFKPFMPETLDTEGSLEGTLFFQAESDHLEGDLSLNLERGALETRLEDKPLRLELSQGALKSTLKENRLQSSLVMSVGEQGRINSELVLDNPLAVDEMRIDGRALIDLPDIKPLGVLIPETLDLDGRLQSQLHFKGSVDQPQITGEVGFSEADLKIYPIGVDYSDINLSATFDARQQVTLSGAMQSEKGRLALTGEMELNPETGYPMDIRIQGENFLVVQLPEAVAYVSPDLSIRRRDETLEIRGEIIIPEAQLEIREIPPGSVALSDDQVIVDHQQTDEEDSPGLASNTSVTLVLGDNVRFSGFGLKTAIRGQMDIDSQNGDSQGHGELALTEGRYAAYGQDLTIEKGDLIFAGPLENPALNLRATRLSNDESVTAILDVTGSLRQPQIAVSSEPLLPEEEALSYLISGKGLNEEGSDKASMIRQAALAKGLNKSQALLDSIASGSGVDTLAVESDGALEDSSLVLGKYLTPDLYISYGVGLFEASNALRLKYRVTDWLRVEAESGAQQSMDLIYQIERD